ALVPERYERLGFNSPYQLTIEIQRDSIPISIGGLGGIEGVVVGLIEVRPVVLRHAELNVPCLPASRDRTRTARKGQLDVRICKGRLNITAADLCPIDPGVHRL